MICGVIFDMDGLMFDTEYLSMLGWIKAGKMLGVVFPSEFLLSFKGVNDSIRRQIFRERFGAGFPYDAAKKMKEEYMESEIRKSGVPIKKGLTELLDYLDREKISRAVATSTQKTEAETYLKLSGVYERIDTIVYGDMVQKSKPEPDIFLAAAKNLGKEAKQCLVLEDSPAGILAGSRAGCKVIHIPDTIPVEEPIKKLALKTLSELSQVIEWIQKENKLLGC